MADQHPTSSLPQRLESYPFIAPEKYVGKLKGKVAIITGASAGLGRDLVKAFAAAGSLVAAVARREPALKSLLEEVESAGGKAIAIVADVSERGAAARIVSETESKLGGPVDILINNAGISRIGDLGSEPQDLDLWWRVYEVNVRAPVTLTRAVLPGMLARKKGILLTISSGVASVKLPVMTAYASSKAAITKFHESLSIELAGSGVLNYTLTPGMVRTELGAPEDAINKAAMEHPALKAFLTHIGDYKAQEPDVMANVAVAMCADPGFEKLDGKFIYGDKDVEAVVEEAAKEGLGRIGKEDLYTVRIREL